MEARISLSKPCALLAILCAALTLFPSCAHKRVRLIERTTADTAIMAKTDSLAVCDTFRTGSSVCEADSVRESVTTFLVIDSTGRVKTAYVWHSKQTAHTKNSSQTSAQTTTAERQTAQSERKVAAASTAESVAVKQGGTPRRWLLCALMAVAVIAAAWLLIKRRLK